MSYIDTLNWLLYRGDMALSHRRQPIELAYLTLTRLSNQEAKVKKALAHCEGEPLTGRAAQLTLVVAAYAIHGALPVDSDRILDYVSELTVLLYGSASDASVAPGPLSDQGTDPVGQMLDAARGRWEVAHLQDVEGIHLAALADVSMSTIKASIHLHGILKRGGPGRVTSESARQWLGKRGCSGFEAPVFRAHATH